MSAELKCEHCGTINAAEETKCRLCGRPLPGPGTRVCPECGHVHESSVHSTCISCGWDMGAPRRPPEKVASSPEACEHWSEKPAHTQRSAAIDIAGILILLAGALGIAHALLSSLPGTREDILIHYERIIPAGEFLDGVIQENEIVGVLMFGAGALAMALSMSVFKRGSLTLSVAGGVLGILAIGFLIGAFFALIGVLVLAASRREFLLECS